MPRLQVQLLVDGILRWLSLRPCGFKDTVVCLLTSVKLHTCNMILEVGKDTATRSLGSFTCKSQGFFAQKYGRPLEIVIKNLRNHGIQPQIPSKSTIWSHQTMSSPQVPFPQSCWWRNPPWRSPPSWRSPPLRSSGCYAPYPSGWTENPDKKNHQASGGKTFGIFTQPETPKKPVTVLHAIE